MENKSPHPIVAKNVSFQYKANDEKALKKVNLEIHEGKFVLLCGPTGSGKTSLVRSINGLIPHFYGGKFYGYMKINGKDTIEESNPAKISKEVGSLFQNPENQLFAMNVERELAFALENLGFQRDEISRRLERAIELTNIHKLRKSAPFRLSGGEQQRVAIASILALDPDILVLDEPLSNLDPKTASDIVALLIRLQKEHQKTILVSEHRIEYVLNALDEIIILQDGKIVVHDSAQKVANSPEFYELGLDIPPTMYWLWKNKKLSRFDQDIPLSLQDQKIIFKQTLYQCLDSLKSVRESSKRTKRTQTDALKKSRTNFFKKEHKAAIVFKDVAFSYSSEPVKKISSREYVLRDLSFSIPKGSIVGILGSNGVGKSTLIRCLLGLLKPQKGSVWIAGENIKDKSVFDVAKTVGLMFQNPDHQLFLNSVKEELEFSLKNLPINEEEKQSRINRTLKELNISDLKQKSPFQVSGGQKKKVSLATILCRNPDILVFDEPTIGQDRFQKNSLIKIIQRHQLKGKTTVIVSHDMDFVANLADRILILHEKGVYTEGTSKEIFSDPHVLKLASLAPLNSLEMIKGAQNGKTENLPADICTINGLEKWLKRGKK